MARHFFLSSSAISSVSARLGLWLIFFRFPSGSPYVRGTAILAEHLVQHQLLVRPVSRASVELVGCVVSPAASRSIPVAATARRASPWKSRAV